MIIEFEKNEIISYPYKPVFINYKKHKYMIVPDFFKKISKIIILEKEYIPTIVPEWLPFSIFLLDDNYKHTYDKFLKILTQNTKLHIGDYENKIKNCMITYHKIIPDCKNSPRFYLYTFDVPIKVLEEFKEIMIKDKNNKLFGVYYYHEKIEDVYRFHFLPISLILSILAGGNKDVISLPFEKKKVEKIGKNIVTNKEVFNANLKMNLPVDINMMIEGKLTESEKVKYSDIETRYNYYKISNYKEFVFKKGKQYNFSSEDGNNDTFRTYLKCLDN